MYFLVLMYLVLMYLLSHLGLILTCRIILKKLRLRFLQGNDTLWCRAMKKKFTTFLQTEGYSGTWWWSCVKREVGLDDQVTSRHLFQLNFLWCCGPGLFSATQQSIFLISSWGLLHSWVEPEARIYVFHGFSVWVWVGSTVPQAMGCVSIYICKGTSTPSAVQKTVSQETATVLQLSLIIWRPYIKKYVTNLRKS